MDARDIIVPAAALTMVAASTMSQHASAQYDSKLNQAENWGGSCHKIDLGGNVMTYTPNEDNIKKVIVKGGTENAVYTEAPFTNLTAPVNPNNGKPYGISHVIICTDDTLSTIPEGIVEGDSDEKPTGGQGNTDDEPTEAPVEQPVTTPVDTVSVQTKGASSDVAEAVPISGKGGTTELPATGAGVSAALMVTGAGAATYTATRALRKQ